MSVLVDLNEKLFSEEEKDLTVQCADGTVSAHKCVLRAASDAFAGLLRHPMREKKTDIISIDDVTVMEMRVFLRLVYTGHVEPADWGAGPGAEIPLDILLKAAEVSKRYMVNGVLSLTTQSIKRRLMNAKIASSISTFERILAASIRADLGAVRMKALELAKDFPKLRTSYDERALRPEVSAELEAIWPMPQAVKRARIV